VPFLEITPENGRGQAVSKPSIALLRLSVRDLILITAIVGLSLALWKSVQRPTFRGSGFIAKVDALRLLERVASSIPGNFQDCGSGMVSNDREPTPYRSAYVYYSFDDEQNTNDALKRRLQQKIKHYLALHECEIVEPSGETVEGYMVRYRFSTGMGVVHFSVETVNELSDDYPECVKLSFAAMEFPLNE
jgi:hypothetical protein